MKRKLKLFNTFLGFIGMTLLTAQPSGFEYSRAIEQPSQLWQKILLPNEIYEKIALDFSDLRIYGIIGNDTLEAPYLLQTKTNTVSSRPKRLKVFNQSSQGNKHLFTFEVKDKMELSELKLKFRENNYNWEIDLEGSQDLEEWYTISENNRIVSILNKQAKYSFSTIPFSPSRYRYYRVSLIHPSRPNLLYGEVSRAYFAEGEYIPFPTGGLRSKAIEKTKETIVDLDLPYAVPVSRIKIKVDADVDYYRAIQIKYLEDSVATDKGLRYYYKTMHEGFISSFETNDFFSTAKTTNKIQLIIRNEDNQPVKIDSIALFGNPTELTVRFPEAEKFFLFYGNEKVGKPRYDIASFTNSIPPNSEFLQLGPEQKLLKDEPETPKPLINNKFWLWAVMVLTILFLGLFTLKMVRDASAN